MNNKGLSSWVNIHLPIVLNNANVYRNYLPTNEIQILAVVKADAYGHGDRIVAKYLSDHSIRHFLVLITILGSLPTRMWLTLMDMSMWS